MNRYRHLYEIISNRNYSSKIVTSDFSAWLNYPKYRHIYNKLWLAESQFIDCGPLGIYPRKYPVIFKPIINLYGMSKSVMKINNDTEYDLNIKDGLFWEEYLDGTHYCVDFIIRDGKILFMSALVSIEDEVDRINRGIFNYHYTDQDYELPEHIKLWIDTFLVGYTGLLNLEIISGIIIEVHFRLNGDFQMYDEKFVEILHNFYENDLDEINYTPKNIYLVPIFLKNRFAHIDRSKILCILQETKVDTIHWDDINSVHQSACMQRLLIVSILKGDDNIENIIRIKKNILNYIENI